MRTRFEARSGSDHQTKAWAAFLNRMSLFGLKSVCESPVTGLSLGIPGFRVLSLSRWALEVP